mgnify:CR=1 FL=1
MRLLNNKYTSKEEVIYEKNKDYVRIIQENGIKPTFREFQPEFGLYIDQENIKDYPEEMIRCRLGRHYEEWLTKHRSIFKGFDDFIDIPVCSNLIKEYF